MPHAVFTNPMIAGVGLTEPEAKKQYGSVVVGVADYTDVAMGNAILDEVGFCKLLFEPNSRQLIGAHIIGKEASTLIHMCIVLETLVPIKSQLRRPLTSSR
jgi:dihydrolipoamide dehydrogenase